MILILVQNIRTKDSQYSWTKHKIIWPVIYDMKGVDIKMSVDIAPERFEKFQGIAIVVVIILLLIALGIVF